MISSPELILAVHASLINEDTLKFLSVVSTCVGIASPVISVLWFLFKSARRKISNKLSQPYKETAGRLRMLEMSHNNDTNTLAKVKEKQSEQDIELKELETKVNLILDNKFGKKD